MANELETLEREIRELEAQLGRTSEVAPVKAESKPSTRAVPSFTEDVTSAARAAKEFTKALPGNVSKGIQSAIKHPKQAAAGLIPGVAALYDTPAMAANFLNWLTEYPVEKFAGRELPEKAKATHIPYIFQEGGTNLANNLVGKPRNEEEEYARETGNFFGAPINPNKLLQLLGKETGRAASKAGGFLSQFSPEKYETLTRAGIKPMLNEVSTGNFVPGVTETLKHAPFGMNRMNVAEAERAKALQDIFKNDVGIGEALGAEQAGRIPRAGAKEYNKKSSSIATKLYDKAWRDVKPKDNVPMTDAISTIEGLYKDLSPDDLADLARSPGGKLIAELYEDLNAPISRSAELGSNIVKGGKLSQTTREPGGLPFVSVKNRYLKKIDNLINTFGEVGTTEQGQLKMVRGAIKNDIKNYALNKNPELAKDFQKADSYYTKLNERNQDIANAAASEKKTSKLFNEVLTAFKEGDTTKIGVLTKRLPKDDRRVLTSSVINELGRAENGAFDPEQFLGRFQNMRPESQNALLSGLEKSHANQVRTIIKGLESVKTFGGKGKTVGAEYLAALSPYIASLGYAAGKESIVPVVGAVSGGFASRGLAELFTNPAVTKAIYEASKARTPAELNKIIGKYQILPKVAVIEQKQSEDLRKEIEDLEKQLGYEPGYEPKKPRITEVPASDFGLDDEDLYTPAMIQIMRSKTTPEDQAGFERVLSGQH